MDLKARGIIKIVLGVLLIIEGWLALGIGFSMKSSYNGAVFYSGFVLIIAGIVVLAIKKKYFTSN